MTEPEISRRCLSCGASVRQAALFCPQCGQPLNHGDVDSDTQEAEQDRRGHDPLLTQPLLNAEAPAILETQPLIPKPDRRDTMIDLGVPQRAEEQPRPEVHQGPLGRVEKIKKVSSVVLDQAAYDPSLRFLLVAAILFVIFLVLMILSKVIG